MEDSEKIDGAVRKVSVSIAINPRLVVGAATFFVVILFTRDLLVSIMVGYLSMLGYDLGKLTRPKHGNLSEVDSLQLYAMHLSHIRRRYGEKGITDVRMLAILSSEGEVIIMSPGQEILWGRWFSSANLRVAESRVGKAWVSTVFLGIDHGFEIGQSLWFETMVFGGKLHLSMERYSTIEEAMHGHDRMTMMVRESEFGKEEQA